MQIGIIGAGNIGGNLAKLFVEAGHKVAIANSRGAETLTNLANATGAKACTAVDAANFGEIVVVSIPLGKISDLPSSGFKGKIVIDTNNYYPDRDGQIAQLDSDETTSSEMLKDHLGDALIVKAFNTIWFEHLKTQGNKDLPLEQRRVIFIAGDDKEAKKTVADLIEEIGFTAYDTGSLADGGRNQAPNTAIYNRNLTLPEASALLGSEGY